MNSSVVDPPISEGEVNGRWVIYKAGHDWFTLQLENEDPQVRMGRSRATIPRDNITISHGQLLLKGGNRGTAWPQYWSELMTSPPLTDPRARQTPPSTDCLMKCTLPSPNRAFTPPGCQLRLVIAA